MLTTSIITVNFHQADVTIALLQSVAKFCNPAQVEVILVDNGAENNQEQLFAPHYGNVTYILSKKNLGFAGGNNLGIAQAKGEYFFFLNNDTEITEGCIETLIAEMEGNHNIGLLSPLLCYFDQQNLIQYAGFTQMNYLTGRNESIGKFEQNKGQYNSISYQTGFCHGAAMMCRKSALEKAGVMDENYFLYYEELDWCEKFKRIDKQIWFTGKTVVYHKESVSVGKESAIKTYFNVRNRMLFIRKNSSLVNSILFTIYYTFIACPKTALNYVIHKRADLASWVFKGLLWNFTHNKNSKELGYKID